MFCKNCNAPIDIGDGVCPNCGAPVKADAASSAAAEQTDNISGVQNLSVKTEKQRKAIILWVSLAVCCAVVLIVVLVIVLKPAAKAPDPVPSSSIAATEPVPQESEKYFGNTLQNVMNEGLSVTDGEYVFFAVRNIDYSKAVGQQNDRSTVYRMKADGSERTPILHVDAVSLNLKDGFIYYSDLKNNTFCKADYNGGNGAVIFPQAIYNALVTDKYIYYIDRSQYSLRRMELDGTNDCKLVEDSVDTYYIMNDEIYYKINESDTAFNKCDLDGKNPQRLDAAASGVPIVTEESIYCTNKTSMVYKVSLDGSQEVMLYDGQANGGLSADDSGYIYFSNIASDKSHISKVKTDGTGFAEICNQRGAKYITVAGDFLFCMDDDEYSFMLKTDGSGYELLSEQRNMESSEYFKSVLKKANSEISDDEIISVECSDYDGNGDKEAFAFVGHLNQGEEYYSGEIWYITKESATRFVERSKYTSVNEVIGFGKKSCVVYESYSEKDESLSYVYGAEGGNATELRISGKGRNLQVDDNGTLIIYQTAYDSSMNGSGKTVKPYYYFYSGDNFCEYGGLELSIVQLKDLPGGLDIIQNVSDERRHITTVYYRDNGVININVNDGEWREYYTARVVNGKLAITEQGEGEYVAALTPKYAVTPESVNLNFQTSAQPQTYVGQTTVYQ